MLWTTAGLKGTPFSKNHSTTPLFPCPSYLPPRPNRKGIDWISRAKSYEILCRFFLKWDLPPWCRTSYKSWYEGAFVYMGILFYVFGNGHMTFFTVCNRDSNDATLWIINYSCSSSRKLRCRPYAVEAFVSKWSKKEKRKRKWMCNGGVSTEVAPWGWRKGQYSAWYSQRAFLVLFRVNSAWSHGGGRGRLSSGRIRESSIQKLQLGWEGAGSTAQSKELQSRELGPAQRLPLRCLGSAALLTSPVANSRPQRKLGQSRLYLRSGCEGWIPRKNEGFDAFGLKVLELKGHCLGELVNIRKHRTTRSMGILTTPNSSRERGKVSTAHPSPEGSRKWEWTSVWGT
jgi:hypothetical protein